MITLYSRCKIKIGDDIKLYPIDEIGNLENGYAKYIHLSDERGDVYLCEISFEKTKEYNRTLFNQDPTTINIESKIIYVAKKLVTW